MISSGLCPRSDECRTGLGWASGGFQKWGYHGIPDAGWFTMETALKIHDHPFQMDDFRGTFDWKTP